MYERPGVRLERKNARRKDAFLQAIARILTVYNMKQKAEARAEHHPPLMGARSEKQQ